MHNPNRIRFARVLVVLLLFGAAASYAWFYLRSTCDPADVRDASAFLLSQRYRFDHAYQFAVTASRPSIDRPVATLQLIHLGTGEADVPGCMQTSKKELLEYMGTVIRAFQAFGAGESDAAIRGLLDESETHYDNFERELDAVNKCAPLCLP